MTYKWKALHEIEAVGDMGSAPGRPDIFVDGDAHTVKNKRYFTSYICMWWQLSGHYTWYNNSTVIKQLQCPVRLH